jgi:hypothetical protein
MHGFIDLVFRHRGYYYLADYKSNRLGLQLPDYDRSGMDRAMQSHRYDLQYLVYTVTRSLYIASWGGACQIATMIATSVGSITCSFVASDRRKGRATVSTSTDPRARS